MINLKIDKTADRSYIFLGLSNKVRYIITITNTGDERANLIKVRDILNKNISFVQGSLTVDGCKRDGFNCIDSIVIGYIDPGASSTITFEVQILNISNEKFISNKAIVTYFDSSNNMYSAESNLLILPIIYLDVCVVKTVDKKVAIVGDVISYTIIIRNNSTVPIDNVVFYDIVPSNLAILPSTVIINSEVKYVESFSGGIPLGTINPNNNFIISFQAKILFIPTPSVICNKAYVEYEYTIISNGIPVTSIGESTSSCATTKILSNNCNC